MCNCTECFCPSKAELNGFVRSTWAAGVRGTPCTAASQPWKGNCQSRVNQWNNRRLAAYCQKLLAAISQTEQPAAAHTAPSSIIAAAGPIPVTTAAAVAIAAAAQTIPADAPASNIAAAPTAAVTHNDDTANCCLAAAPAVDAAQVLTAGVAAAASSAAEPMLAAPSPSATPQSVSVLHHGTPAFPAPPRKTNRLSESASTSTSPSVSPLWPSSLLEAAPSLALLTHSPAAAISDSASPMNGAAVMSQSPVAPISTPLATPLSGQRLNLPAQQPHTPSSDNAAILATPQQQLLSSPLLQLQALKPVPPQLQTPALSPLQGPASQASPVMDLTQVCAPAAATASFLTTGTDHAFSTPDAAKPTALTSPCLETLSPCLQPMASIAAPTSAGSYPAAACLAQRVAPLQTSAPANMALLLQDAEQQQQAAQEVTDPHAAVRTNDSSKNFSPTLRTMAESRVTPLLKQQLTQVDLTDAATRLVLAVATAAAATPAERARAGLFPWPYYFIGTRDSFTHELIPIQSQVSNRVRAWSCKRKCFASCLRCASDSYAIHVYRPNSSMQVCRAMTLHTYTALLTCAMYYCKVELDAWRIQSSASCCDASTSAHSTCMSVVASM